jgi:hypothetical protein
MKVLLENQLIDKYTFCYEGANLLGFDSLEEVFFDVYEIKSKNYQIIKEKKEIKNDLPVVHLDLTVDNVLYKNIRFELVKENIVKINHNSLNRKDSVLLEQKKEQKPKAARSVIKESVITSPKVDLVKSYLQKESKKGVIKDLIRESTKETFKELLLDEPNDKELYKFFENYNSGFYKKFIEIAEKIAKRESLRAMESGGGNNAVQFSNGGKMDGDLTVTGTIYGEVYGAIKRKVFNIGDGLNRYFKVDHYFNSYDIIMNIYDNNTNEQVFPYIQNISPNETTVGFSDIVALNAFRVVILG